MAKKVNWVEVKKRYLQGEKPKDIAVDYEGLTSDKISQKAKRDVWKPEKDNLSQKVGEVVQNELKEFCDITLAVHKEFMMNLQGQLQTITNPYLFDGERTNSLFQTAMNNATKIYLATLKGEEANIEEEPAGFNVSLDA
jgi:hypothetical protein